MNEQIETTLSNLISAIEQRNQAQDAALEEAVTIIKQIEARLVAALNGRLLPGAPDLSPFDHATFLAWRVRTEDPAQEFKKLGDDGMDQYLTQPSLCLTRSGRFARIESGFADEIYWVESKDGPGFVAKDLQRVVTLLEKIIPEIIAVLKKQHRRYSDIRELAKKLAN